MCGASEDQDPETSDKPCSRPVLVRQLLRSNGSKNNVLRGSCNRDNVRCHSTPAAAPCAGHRQHVGKGPIVCKDRHDYEQSGFVTPGVAIYGVGQQRMHLKPASNEHLAFVTYPLTARAGRLVGPPRELHLTGSPHPEQQAHPTVFEWQSQSSGTPEASNHEAPLPWMRRAADVTWSHRPGDLSCGSATRPMNSEIAGTYDGRLRRRSGQEAAEPFGLARPGSLALAVANPRRVLRFRRTPLSVRGTEKRRDRYLPFLQCSKSYPAGAVGPAGALR
jgi:hypothetical protein